MSLRCTAGYMRGAQTDKELAGFYGAYSALRNELLKLVSDYSADWMLNEDYR